MVRSEGLRLRTIAVALPVALAVALLMLMGLGSSLAHAAPSTFTVNSTADTGDATPDGTCDSCTLREAIQEANANNNTAEQDQINFNISGDGVHTISPGSILPFVTEPVIINGYSQPHSSVNSLAKGTNAKLLIEIDGTNFNDRGLTIRTSNSVVKGLVINRFGGIAIAVGPDFGADLVTNVRIEGNFIGTDPTGIEAQANDGGGVDLFATSNSTVGGTSLAARNLISGNNFSGVFIEGGATTGDGSADNNKVQGNLIGTQKDGIQALGNGTEGVGLLDDDTDGNRILSNSIFSNEGLGIDLGDNGLTLNDTDDPDPGPNNLQNFPVVSTATTTRRATTIAGTLNSTPSTTFTLQFFSNPPASPDEGQTFKVQKSVSTDNGGDGTFSFKLKRGKKIAVGQFVTATATAPNGNTSEFSLAQEVVRP